MKKLLLVVLALVLGACSAMGNSGQPKSDLELAREKWESADISHYRFNLFISCFCVFNENMPLVIEVNNGEVVSMEFQNGKEIDPQFLDLFNRYATIDKLFEGLATSFDIPGDEQGAAEKVTVEYDATNGFPTKIDIDFIEQAVDDELYLTVSNFEALP